jgi:hypothetical protein
MDAPSLDSDDDPLEVVITHSALSDEVLVEALKTFFDKNKSIRKKSKMDCVIFQRLHCTHYLEMGHQNCIA